MARAKSSATRSASRSSSAGASWRRYSPRAWRARAVIFDFEGTLVDFQWQLEPAERELRLALARLGLEGGEFASGNYASMWNAAAARLGSAGGLCKLRGALGPIYDRWDADALSRWAPRPGAAAVLGRLAASGARVGLVSNVGRAALEQALARFGLARWLRPIVTRDDVGRMKPDAEGVFAVLREWRLPADTVLFVGDSRADVLAARNSGLRVAIVRGGECGDSGLAGAQPDFMLTRLDEIPERCFGQQPARDLARVHLSGRRPGARAE